MKKSGGTALAIDAERTLLFDRDELIESANAAVIAIQAFPPVRYTEPMGDSVGMKKR